MKGSSQIWWVLALTLIPLVVLIIVAMGESSLLDELKLMTKGLDQFLPDVNRGLPELKAGEIAFTTNQQERITEFKQTLLAMKGKQNCFAKYGLDLQGVQVTLSYDGKNLQLQGKAGASAKQNLKPEIVGTGLQPCVIAGDPHAENFLNRILFGNDNTANPYFQNVNEITLFNDGVNKITYDQKVTSTLNDGGWLYTPDGKYICFFPTADHSNGYSINGLDSGYVSGSVENSISFGINNRRLKLCSEPLETSYESLELFDALAQNQVQTIRQTCEGRVGDDDCLAWQSKSDESCNEFFPEIRAYKGCWVMATTQQDSTRSSFTCAWWEAPTGQLLTPYLLGYSASGNVLI